MQRRLPAIISWVFVNRDDTGFSMLTRLSVLFLLSLGLAGCAVGQVKLPMMTLGPSDTPKASCLTYDDAPAFGDCQGKDAVSIPQNTN